MSKISTIVLLSGMLTGFSACDSDKVSFDASGVFEAEEVIVSSEATGKIMQFDIEEGQKLAEGQVIGYVDSVLLHLKKEQLEAQITALLGKKPNVPVQLSTLRAKLETAEREKVRITNLLEGGAVPAKQLDDINARITVLNRQIDARKSTLSISSEGLNKEVVPLQVQMEEVKEQLSKCKIVNPIAGTVLVKYAEANEMTATGKPLYKIADLSHIILRAYIAGNQFTQVKLNQPVKVLTDDGKGGYRETSGTLIWISDEAEFTPKTIQTKEERADRVYAIKIRVKNDGTYKIGMYAEVLFH